MGLSLADTTGPLTHPVCEALAAATRGTWVSQDIAKITLRAGGPTFSISFLQQVPVDDYVIKAIALGAAMVWDHHILEDSVHRVLLVDYLNDPSVVPHDQQPAAKYFPDSDLTVFSVRMLQASFLTKAPLEDRWLILSAHETTHKVQHHRNPSEPSGNGDMGKMTPREKEAWIEALAVLKAVKPNVSATIEVGGVTVSTPQASHYIDPRKQMHWTGIGS